MPRFMLITILCLAGNATAADTTPVDGLVRNIKVLPDKAPDCTTLKNIALSVTRDCKTNDEKLIAIYNFMVLSHYHRTYPPGSAGLEWYTNYGWSLCGGLASLQSSLFEQLGWSYRGVSWPGHNMAEAKYDGKWHWFDCFLKFYAWRPDKDTPSGWTIASQDDLAGNAKELLNEQFIQGATKKLVYFKDDNLELIDGKLNWTAPALLTCEDLVKDGVVQPPPSQRRFMSEKQVPFKNNANNDWDSKTYSAELNLTPGFALENTWGQLATPAEAWPVKDKHAVGHTCGNKDLRSNPSAGLVLEPYYQHPRSYSNGRLIFAPDFSSAAVLRCFAEKTNVKFENGALVPEKPDAPASVTVAFETPYLIVKATGTAEGADNFEQLLSDFSTKSKNKLKGSLKIPIKTALKALRLEVIVMNNAGVLPYLSPGKNTVSVSVESPESLGENKLVVTYAYAPGYRTKSFDELFAAGAKYLFTQQAAVWADKPTVVQKIFSAKDLPATFEIDVPTPKDMNPVYPRMLLLRRELIAPDGKPLPLPENAQPPAMNPADELKTLPNPFLIGTTPPALRKKSL